MEMLKKVEKEDKIVTETKDDKGDVTMDPEGEVGVGGRGEVVVGGGAAQARARPGARQAARGQQGELGQIVEKPRVELEKVLPREDLKPRDVPKANPRAHSDSPEGELFSDITQGFSTICQTLVFQRCKDLSQGTTMEKILENPQ